MARNGRRAWPGLEEKTGACILLSFRAVTLHFPEALVETDRQRKRVLILGAAGRDFHNFNVCFRNAPDYQVVAFTAAQIPGIESRRYPPSLSGSLYPDGIPIYAEERLEELIRTEDIQQVIFAYSDVSHVALMHLASRALACGADFSLIGPERSSLMSLRPVISVCAVRTGCGRIRWCGALRRY